MRGIDMDMDRHYLWLDLETTGLDPDKCSVIEFACILTDSKFHKKFRYHAFLKSMIEEWDEEAREMHRSSGLLKVRDDLELADCQTSVNICSDVLNRMQDIDGRVWLAGIGPHFDRRFLRRRFQSLDDRLHYRHFDIRPMMAMAQDAFGVDYKKRLGRDHRAFKDVQKSIEIAREIYSNFQGIEQWNQL